jgi:hypothetical protein
MMMGRLGEDSAGDDLFEEESLVSKIKCIMHLGVDSTSSTVV